MLPGVPGSQVQGDDEFQSFLKQEIQKAVAENVQTAQNVPGASPQQPAEPPAEKPIKVNLGGQEYSFANEQALSQALQQTFSGFQTELAKRNEPAPGQGSQVTGDEAPAFSVEHYAELMAKDPIAASDYVDSHRYFGGKVEKPSAVINERLLAAEKTEKVLAAYQFKEAHPEFSVLPGQQAAQVVDQIRTQLGLPFSLDGLEASYALAQQRGMLPSREQIVAYVQAQQQQQSGQQHQPPPQQNPYAPPPPQFLMPGQFQPAFGSFNPPHMNPALPPPSPGRSTYQQEPSIAEMAENLTPEQIEAIFARAQQMGVK